MGITCLADAAPGRAAVAAGEDAGAVVWLRVKEKRKMGERVDD